MIHGGTWLARSDEFVCNYPMADSRYDIAVRVRTTYLAEQSDPDNGRYAFAYTVTITNKGSVGAKLVSRHWIITDGLERVEDPNRIEAEPAAFHAKVRAAFLELAHAEPDRYLVLHAHDPREEIAARVLSAVLERLAQR